MLWRSVLWWRIAVYQYGTDVGDDAGPCDHDVPHGVCCAGRIAEMLQTETSIRDGSFSLQERPLRSTVEFRHVTFAYPGAQEPILKDISFEAHPGEITAIIGGTGRGNPVS